MWIILALAMVEYFAISIFIPIDPYASKGNKRLKDRKSTRLNSSH
mgnify:CR=1 FL=1